MGESAAAADEAGSSRAQRRRENARQITLHAQRLTDTRGLDGFTMDDLAASAGVSRRTLFNYFAGKDEAVLGLVPPLDPVLLERFVTRSLGGSLFDDMVQIVVALFEEHRPTRDQLALERRVLASNPRLLGLATRRMEQYVEDALPLIEQREGADHDPDRARVAVRLVATLVHSALTSVATDPAGADLTTLLRTAARHTHSLLLPDDVPTRR